MRTELEKMSLEELYLLEDKTRGLRENSFGEEKEDLEELLFDIRLVRRLKDEDYTFIIDGIKNNIINTYGGVEEFVRDYGGDYFNEERVEWFIKNQDYFQQSVWDFMDDWNVCFPS